MSRRPVIFATLLSLPFGVMSYLSLQMPRIPRPVPTVLAVFAGFLFFISVLFQMVAPAPPRMRPNETVISTRHPSRLGAYLRLGASVFGLIGAAYAYLVIPVPAIAPIAGAVVGTVLFAAAIHSYWRSSMRAYYLTDRRLICIRRFVSLQRTEIPLDEVGGIEERRSIAETLIGAGNVKVASGGTDTLVIELTRIPRPAAFVDELRTLVVQRSETRFTPGTRSGDR